MTPQDSPTQQLREHPFLAFFDEQSKDTLAGSAQVLDLEEGKCLFQEGDPADSIYLVLHGSVRLTKKDPEGKDQLLAFVGENDFFGEFGVLDGKPRSAGAFAAANGVTLARLPGELVTGVFKSSGAEGMVKIALHIIGKVRDINERYVEERLRKERMTLIGEMADQIIHDLKSPFCVIQLISDMIRKKPSDDVGELCDMLESQLVRMQTLVEEILEFSRGSAQLNLTEMRVAELLGRFETYNHEYLKRSEVELRVIAAPMTIRADRDKMLRVIQNLVNNGVEAMEGQPGHIEIRCEKAGETARITIADDGPGVPETMRASLFEPFATKGKSKGTGLGMAIAKSIVEAHHGALTFESTAGEGTTFTITLPSIPDSLES